MWWHMNNTIETETKASRLLLVAWMETEKRLPAESKALIEAHDALYDQWRRAGWPSPIPPELAAASDAVEADPLAKIPFEFRKRCNELSHEEWRKENP
jgi:hypothetical protein